MTVYAKIENGQLITAYNGYNGIIGLADSPDLCLANGFTAYEDDINGSSLIDKYFAGMAVIQKNKLVDITDTDEYKAKLKAQQIQQAMATRDAVIDSVTNSVLLDQLQLSAGLITQSVFDARKAAKTAIYSKAVDDFYTTTGLTKPKTIGV